MKIKRGEKKRFALLLACKDSDYAKKVYGGYFHVFKKAFGERDEYWDLYRVIDGDFPNPKDLDQYDGFVVSGSPCDAFGNDPWIFKLCDLLQKLDEMEKKVLGICFGHQVLCRALGGKVRRSDSGWDLGLRKVKLVDVKLGFLDNLGEEIPDSLAIIKCHQDEVWEVPERAEVLGSSDKTGAEMFGIGDHVLGIQGHPEYTKDILFDIVDRLLYSEAIKREVADEAKLKLESAEPDRIVWEKICKSFLKGR
ncbi:glucosinolate gamma-glutamyl hydrolase [Ranunculus cassubicifolius]